jgi:hypothetical protein
MVFKNFLFYFIWFYDIIKEQTVDKKFKVIRTDTISDLMTFLFYLQPVA